MRILVELDAILDTRLATVARIKPEAAVALVEHRDYYSRKYDNFEEITGIPHEEYLEAYRKRDKETLKISCHSHALIMLWEMTEHLHEMMRLTPEVDSVMVDINTYPYDLTADEIEDICTSVQIHCFPGTAVVSSNYSPIQISPLKLKRDYNAYILYNFDPWYSTNAPLLVQLPMPRVTIFAPAIFIKEEPEWKEEDKKYLVGRDPFGMVEEMHFPFVKFRFLDSSGFSILQHWKLEK